MKRILTYTTALTLLAAPAFADTEAKMDLIRSAQQMLNEYDISVNADSLTMDQLAEIKGIDGSDRSKAEMQLEQIVNASSTETNVTGDVSVPTVDVEAPESEVVQSILDEFEIAADADALSDSQKAEILAVDVSDRSMAEQKLEAIVAG